MTRFGRWVAFHPITAWALCVGAAGVSYLFAAGVAIESVTRALAGCALLLFAGMTAQTRIYYHLANKRAPDPDRGALPKHVARISESYMVLVIYVVVDLWMRAGEPLSWRVPVAALAATLGFQALLPILDFERRRVHVISPYVTDLRGAPPTEDRRH